MITLLAIFASLAFGQEKCSEKSGKNYPEFVSGIGTGATYDEAKQSATTDMLGYFSTKIEGGATFETSDHSDDRGLSHQNFLNSRTTSSVSGIAKGVEVLETCRNESGVTTVVGVRKKMVKDLLIKDATERSAALNELFKKVASANSKSGADRSFLAPTKGQLDTLIAQESKAMETWLLLGLQTTHFPSLSKKVIEDIRTYVRNHHVSYRLLTTGMVAAKSLSKLKHLLLQSGFEISDGKDAIPMTWMCDLLTYNTVGTATRFKVSCRIMGDETILDPIDIEGIATSGQLEDTALRLVLARLDRRP